MRHRSAIGAIGRSKLIGQKAARKGKGKNGVATNWARRGEEEMEQSKKDERGPNSVSHGFRGTI